MKILFDTNTPAPLARFLRKHEVALSVNAGWDSLEDGALLSTAEEAGFDVLITCDQSIPYQQNFHDRKIAVLVLTSNRWPLIRPRAPQIAQIVEFVQRGQVRRIDVSPT